MKKLFIALMVANFFIVNFATAATVSKVLSMKDINGLRVITTKHGVASTHKNAIIKTDVFGANCNQGAFINMEENPGVYSALLAAVVSKYDSVEFVLDDSIKSPWGNLNYCALIVFQLNM
jgi:hypothetical protein